MYPDTHELHICGASIPLQHQQIAFSARHCRKWVVGRGRLLGSTKDVPTYFKRHVIAVRASAADLRWVYGITSGYGPNPICSPIASGSQVLDFLLDQYTPYDTICKGENQTRKSTWNCNRTAMPSDAPSRLPCSICVLLPIVVHHQWYCHALK